jgi:hypothetical protein
LRHAPVFYRKRHRRPHRRKAQASQEEKRAAQQELANKFKRGMAVCLEALGYAAK